MLFDSSGLQIDTFQEILDALGAAQRAQSALGATWVTSPDSPQGQLNAVFADRLRQVQEVLLSLYQSWDRSSASGQMLTNLALITGTKRRLATNATVTATVNLNAGVTLPAGSQANVTGDPDTVFETIADATNSGGVAANVSVEMEAVVAGSAAFAAAGTLTEITTPVSGWNSVTNALDSVSGQDDELDSELRIRSLRELSARGSANLDALVAAVSAVDSVNTLQGYANTTEDTDANGLPPHSFEIVVLGGDDDEIAQAIYDNAPVGIEPYGTDSGTATDAAGNDHTVAFTRPTEIQIHIQITGIDTDPLTYTDAATLKASLVQACEDTFGVGDDVRYTKVVALISDSPGVLDFVAQTKVTGGAFATTNITIGVRELPVFDTTRVTVA
jgi:uncharacterized phage protein gp47/JayE